MSKSRLPIHVVKYLPWAILSIALFYLTALWLWKRAFIFGDARGIYWLLILLDWTVLPITIISLLSFIIEVIVLIAKFARRQADLRFNLLRSGILLFSSLLLIFACFPALVTPSIPLGALPVHGRVYYLSLISALIDSNYSLYECDRLGVICKQVYRSGDFSLANPTRASMIYDESSNTLSINIEGQGDVYFFNPE